MRCWPIAVMFWRMQMVDRRITFSVDFYIMYALMLLLLPLRWVFAWVTAAAVHELCHIFALLLCRRSITSLHITAAGASILTEDLDPVQDILCSLAGPVGGLCLLFLAEIFPRAALCALWQSGYNLLPLRNMDGGRALFQGLVICFGEGRAVRLQTVIHYTLLVLICAFSLWAGLVWRIGLLPIVISAVIVLRNRKNPCKENF